MLHAGEYISDESEKLYLDKLWLYLHADPEPSVGDYLPSGMDLRKGVISYLRIRVGFFLTWWK